MRARSAAREAALQMLFAADLAHHEPDTIIGDYWRELPGDADDRPYADEALRGVLADRPRIDEHITRASERWRLERMNAVTRNVLRLGTWELLERHEVPRAVIIDEAVELAKRFDSQPSAAFVNGVLDRVANDCGRVDVDRPPSDEVTSDTAADAPLVEETLVEEKLVEETAADEARIHATDPAEGDPGGDPE
jgi:N utilization substance protein B